MNLILIYLGSYFLTLFGYLLAKASFEELEELEYRIKFTKLLGFTFFYSILGFLSFGSYLLFPLLVSFFLFFISLIKPLFRQLHNLLFFVTTFFISFIYLDLPYLFLFSVYLLILSNSIYKFRTKEEFYNLIFLICIFILFSLLSSLNI